MHYFGTIVYNVTSRNAINLLGTAIASDSFLVSKQVLTCQRDDWTCHFFFGRQIISYKKGIVLVNLLRPGFHYTTNTTTTTQKQSDYKVEQSSFTLIALFWLELVVVVVVIALKPGFHYKANATTTTQKQSDYKVEQSSFTLIALSWLEIGRCRGRNWLNGNQA